MLKGEGESWTNRRNETYVPFVPPEDIVSVIGKGQGEHQVASAGETATLRPNQARIASPRYIPRHWRSHNYIHSVQLKIVWFKVLHFDVLTSISMSLARYTTYTCTVLSSHCKAHIRHAKSSSCTCSSVGLAHPSNAQDALPKSFKSRSTILPSNNHKVKHHAIKAVNVIS